MGAGEGIVNYMRMIRIAHSIFALPFALSSALLAAGGMPLLRQLFWIIVAMVGARSGAMGLNRVIDRGIDAANPRTQGREIPAGKVRVGDALVFSALSLGAMVFAAYMLNPLCFLLSPIAIAILAAYSYMKRFTWGSHLFLGLALALAPVGAWAAVRGTLDPEVVLLALAVLFWLPGFDIIYAIMDVEFDRSHGVYSIPARFGVGRALLIARVLHALSFGCLVATGIVFDLGLAYFAGMAAVGGLFVYEHALVRNVRKRNVKNGDTARVMAAFNLNGYIGLAVFASTLAGVLL